MNKTTFLEYLSRLEEHRVPANLSKAGWVNARAGLSASPLRGKEDGVF